MSTDTTLLHLHRCDGVAGEDAGTFVAHTFSEEDRNEVTMTNLRDDLDRGREVADSVWRLFTYLLLFTRVRLARTIMVGMFIDARTISLGALQDVQEAHLFQEQFQELEAESLVEYLSGLPFTDPWSFSPIPNHHLKQFPLLDYLEGESMVFVRIHKFSD